MQYMLLIYGSDEGWASLPEAEREAQLQEYMTLGDRYPQVRGGSELQPSATATTVRVRGGDVLTTDGPFVETKEQLGGFFLLECDNIDEALEIAAAVPAARTGGAVEVRPVAPHGEEAGA